MRTGRLALAGENGVAPLDLDDHRTAVQARLAVAVGDARVRAVRAVAESALAVVVGRAVAAVRGAARGGHATLDDVLVRGQRRGEPVAARQAGSDRKSV